MIPVWGLVISASSVVAQFRRGFSTTSALTYPFPPRTAVIGIVGAILGANKKTREGTDLLKELDEKLLVGVRWVRGRITTFGINNMYGKDEKGIKSILPGAAVWADQNGKGHIVHLPTPTEFVIHPEYEITLLSRDKDLLERIEHHVEERRMKYAPYLGVQGALARLDIEVTVTAAERVESDSTTDYTVPEGSADVYPENNVFVAIFPRSRDYSDSLRKVTEYSKVYWTTPGKSVRIKPKGEVWEVDGRTVPAY